MSSSVEINKSIDTLLAVISTKLDKVMDELKEVKQDIRDKASVKDFDELKKEVSSLQEKSEQLHNKWWFASGLATAASYIFQHLIK